MEVNNLAIEKFPKSFDQIHGHKNTIKIIRNWIAKDKLPPGILLSGKPGVGKGCIAHNLIKSTLCRVRKPEESDGCGKCDICTKLDPRNTHPSNNVMWVQVGSGNSSTINSQIKEAIEFSRRPPTGNRLVDLGSKYHKFVVVDELQRIDQPLLEQLYLALEDGNSYLKNRTTFILITMNQAYLEAKNPIGYDALDKRMGKGYIYLNPPGLPQLHEYAYTELNVIDNEVRELLVEAANFSYRGLIAAYEKILDLPSMNNLDLIQSRLRLASYSTRKKFWELFSSGSFELWSFWNLITQEYGEYPVAKQLYNDLLKANNLTNVPLDFHKAYIEYLKNPEVIKFFTIISPYIGTFTVSLPAPTTPINNVANVSAI